MDCNAVHVQGVEMPAIQGGGGRGSFVDAMTADGNDDVVDVEYWRSSVLLLPIMIKIMTIIAIVIT